MAASGNGCGITIRGVDYRTLTEAAKAIGVSQRTIKRYRQYGMLDLVGLTPRPGDPPGMIERPCMICVQPFWSSGRHHRMCDMCRRSVSEIA